jgi:hypothetical protein
MALLQMNATMIDLQFVFFSHFSRTDIPSSQHSGHQPLHYKIYRQEEQDRRSFFGVRMLCFSRGVAHRANNQMTRAISLLLLSQHQTDEAG